jgi:hypothetical protein
LEERRSRLRDKLQSEHETFKIEIKDLEDTPAIVRQRMRNEVQTIISSHFSIYNLIKIYDFSWRN